VGVQATQKLVSSLHHKLTAARVIAERAVNARLQGGCQVPIASFAEIQGGSLWLRALVGEPDGSRILRYEDSAKLEKAEALGIEVADNLLAQGAGAILAALSH
ncbi:MAG: hydroxymethylbilane synthase, partial [Pseudohongiellaceae bacterium]